MDFDFEKLAELVREELEARPEVSAQVVIDQVTSEMLEPLDLKECMGLLILGDLPCERAVNQMVPCATFLSPTYKEGIRAAAWVMATTLLQRRMSE